MDDLHWRDEFNVNKFNHLCDLLSKYDGNDPQVHSLAFKLYSNVLKKVSYHNDINDGFEISNIDDVGLVDIYELIDNLESIVQSLCEK